MTKHTLSFLGVTISLALALGGCTEQVVGGVEPATSALTGASAIALKGSSLPDDAASYLTSMGAKVDDDELYVFIGNASATCASPSAFTSDTCGTNATDTWQVVIGLPPALQKVGTVSLATAGVDDILGVAGVGTSSGAATCTEGSSPNGLTGEIGVVKIDATSVTIDLMGNVPNFWIGAELPTLTAEFVAPICP